MCEVDADCSVKITECGCCASAISCVNTDWTPECPDVDYHYINHPCETFSCLPPTPPWFDNCKCINNTCTNCRGNECKNDPEKEIKFEELTAIINTEDKNCSLDNDCVLFQPDCEDCKFDAINKKMLPKYSEVKKDFCSINKPEIMCDIVFTGELKCINNKCTIE